MLIDGDDMDFSAEDAKPFCAGRKELAIISIV